MITSHVRPNTTTMRVIPSSPSSACTCRCDQPRLAASSLAGFFDGSTHNQLDTKSRMNDDDTPGHLQSLTFTHQSHGSSMSASTELTDLWSLWQQHFYPFDRTWHYQHAGALIECQFIRQLRPYDAAFTLVRPSLASEPSEDYPLIRVVHVTPSLWREFLHAAGSIGARGVVLDTWIRDVRHLSVDGFEPWNSAAGNHDGFSVNLTPIGQLIQRADAMALHFRIRGRADLSRGDAMLKHMVPRFLYLPWIDAILHVFRSLARKPIGEHKFWAGADQLASGQFELTGTGTLDFPHLLFRGRDPIHADMGIVALQLVGDHLGVVVRVPVDTGLYTWASHPEEDFVTLTASDADDAKALRTTGTLRTLLPLVRARPLPDTRAAALAVVGPIASLLDAVRFGDDATLTDDDQRAMAAVKPGTVARALLDQRRWPSLHQANAGIMPRPLRGLLAFWYSARHPVTHKSMRAERVDSLWDYLLALQVVEPPELVRNVTVELSQPWGLGGTLTLLVFQPKRDTKALLDRASGEDEPLERRPVRLVRITDYRFALACVQPDVAPEVMWDLDALRRIIGRFLRRNHADLAPCPERYRMAFTIDGGFYARITGTVIPQLDTADGKIAAAVAAWNALPAYGDTTKVHVLIEL